MGSFSRKHLQNCYERMKPKEQAGQTPKSLESRIVRDLRLTFVVIKDKFFGFLDGLELIFKRCRSIFFSAGPPAPLENV